MNRVQGTLAIRRYRGTRRWPSSSGSRSAQAMRRHSRSRARRRSRSRTGFEARARRVRLAPRRAAGGNEPPSSVRTARRSRRFADAELVVVIGDDPVVERAPVVDLWIRAARRNGAEIVTFGPAGTTSGRRATVQRCVRELARPAHGARQAAARRRARGDHLVGAGWPRRRRARPPRARARLPREGRLRRLLPPRDAERSRGRPSLGGRRRGRAGPARPRRPADRLGRGSRLGPARAFARGAQQTPSSP